MVAILAGDMAGTVAANLLKGRLIYVGQSRMF